MQALSVIIPVYNEQATIASFLTSIEQALHQSKRTSEIIIIDDHSSDGTLDVLRRLAMSNPTLKVYSKVGRKGKAQSIVEGATLAKYPLLAVIDAGGRYDATFLPELVQHAVAHNADVVIGRRSSLQSLPLLQRVGSRLYYHVVCRGMHHLPYDVQSGMKVFSKSVLDRVAPLMDLTPWAFDLQFLALARDAGYRIDQQSITYANHHKTSSFKKLFSQASDMGTSALRHRLRANRPIPFDQSQVSKLGSGFHFKGLSFIHHSGLDWRETAFRRVNRRQSTTLLVLLVVLIGLLLWNWHLTVVVFIAALTFMYFADLIFNFFLIYRSFSVGPELAITPEQLRERDVKGWPTYTIFCPLYKEAHVLPQFVEAMGKFSYPQEKLQIMLLLEQDDIETQAAAKTMNLPANFQVVIVPPSNPKTKPKACNYGLTKATGEYVVIYDAEDVPDPMQLKKVVIAFEKADKRTFCVQAKLNFYNPHQNVLTRIFTAEYSLWFDLVLTGLQSIQAPIPLGGTSNHFRTNDLRTIQGWDAFNVTEDCDLGIRLTKRGYKTAIIDSVTLEEANSNGMNWFLQRTRWIKGYMQTYLVHTRSPGSFFENGFNWSFVTFQLVVGGKVLSMFINPLMWLTTICYFAFRARIAPFIETFFPGPILYMGLFSLIIGNFLYLYYYMIGCMKRGQEELVKYVFLVPFYWLAMSLAAWVAFYNLLKRPHHWFKTKHGLHLANERAVAQTSAAILANS